MKNDNNKPGVFGISFDGVSMSGVIVEFIKMSAIFQKNNHQIYLDLGYEIKSDKNNFYKPYVSEKALLPSWINLIKIIPSPFDNYSKEFVETIFDYVNNNSIKSTYYEKLIESYAKTITEKIISLWRKLNIRVVIVENGTLPENVVFTKALYDAIKIYGEECRLSKYVIWRDHDLMWSSESNDIKYGRPPYVHVPKIIKNYHIVHVVLNQADHAAVMNWCPEADVSILKNEFKIQLSSISKRKQALRHKFRNHYRVPKDAYVIARYTRIIPQKRIDRDIYLLFALKKMLKQKNNQKSLYLFIAGDTNENLDEFKRLQMLIRELTISANVVFTGILKPTLLDDENNDIHSIQSLILASDVCSFLTSFNYESFGNPISEAISFGKPYISTTYERYQHVYGEAGYRGVMLPINHKDNDVINKSFINEVYDLLIHDEKRLGIINYNFSVMKISNKNKKNLKNRISTLLNLHLV